MANSTRFLELVRRVKTIEKHLLPRIQPTGNYSKREQDKIRGYRLLVHAELEAYFEERAKAKILEALNNWKNTRAKSNVLLSLMSYNDVAYTSMNNEQNIVDRNLETRIQKATTHFITKIGHNNGIKEINILQLLCPIGIEITDFQQAWLNDLNSFGVSRGLIAHSSAAAQQPIDPASEKTLILSIVSELKNIDKKINLLV